MWCIMLRKQKRRSTLRPNYASMNSPDASFELSSEHQTPPASPTKKTKKGGRAKKALAAVSAPAEQQADFAWTDKTKKQLGRAFDKALASKIFSRDFFQSMWENSFESDDSKRTLPLRFPRQPIYGLLLHKPEWSKLNPEKLAYRVGKLLEQNPVAFRDALRMADPSLPKEKEFQSTNSKF